MVMHGLGVDDKELKVEEWKVGLLGGKGGIKEKTSSSGPCSSGFGDE